MAFSETLKIELKQETELNPEELKRREEIRSVIERIVFENYWKPISEYGQHVIARSIDIITSEIYQLYGGDENEIKKIVLDCILESPGPNDLKPDAVGILADAVRSGESIFIWTIGDKGAYTDDKSHITYPAFNFQEKKIRRSQILDKLNEEVPKTSDNARDASENVSVNIGAKDKREGLHEALIKFREMNVQHVYVVDDVRDNLDMIAEVSKKVGGPLVHEYHITKIGNLTKCREYISGKRQEHLSWGEKMGLIIDWDNTLYDEPKRVQRSAQMIAFKLLEKIIK